MTSSFTGGCQCGAVRYECSAEPAMSTNCYCRNCQRSSGGPVVTHLGVPRDSFRITKGEPKVFRTTADSGNRISRAFCGECGSPLFGESEGFPDLVVLRVGGLDDPNPFRPAMNVFLRSAPPWAPVREDLLSFPGMPEG